MTVIYGCANHDTLIMPNEREQFLVNYTESTIHYKNIESYDNLIIDVTSEMLAQFTREEEHLISSSYADREPRYGLVEIPCTSLSQLTPKEIIKL